MSKLKLEINSNNNVITGSPRFGDAIKLNRCLPHFHVSDCLLVNILSDGAKDFSTLRESFGPNKEEYKLARRNSPKANGWRFKFSEGLDDL